MYYILHYENLSEVIRDGGLLSDKAVRSKSIGHTNIGMSRIKEARMLKSVPCHPGTVVGDYVPFYLCPRSVMLYVIHCANHPGLTYRGGQGPIVHLEFDAAAVVNWARDRGHPWAVSYGNAAAAIARFATGIGCMDGMNWEAIGAQWFNKPDVQEAKQSEVLAFGSVPWHLVERIGVVNQAMRQRIVEVLGSATHRPAIAIRPDWYF
ncbi:MAG: DUF4433 domain-containing protein [Cytophagaceae bacterium]|nr:MAG: DUF4433 domain-containing protein [Cytophagaceae bacterium]